MIYFYCCQPYYMNYLFNSPHFNYRPITDSDLPHFVDIYTSQKLMQFVSEPFSEQEAKSLFKRFSHSNNTRPQHHYLFSVVNNIDQELIGFCGVNSIKSDMTTSTKTGEIGVMLIESAIGKGIGTEVLMALVEYCFKELGFKKLVGPPSQDNIASIKMLEKAGFRKEALLKGHIKIKGDQIDTPLYVVYKSA